MFGLTIVRRETLEALRAECAARAAAGRLLRVERDAARAEASRLRAEEEAAVECASESDTVAVPREQIMGMHEESRALRAELLELKLELLAALRHINPCGGA